MHNGCRLWLVASVNGSVVYEWHACVASVPLVAPGKLPLEVDMRQVALVWLNSAFLCATVAR